MSVGYSLSPAQLDELWRYDMWLAYVLMDLPLRSCSAMPAASQDFPALSPSEFMALKTQVRAMWIFASHHFAVKMTENGWGLFFKDTV